MVQRLLQEEHLSPKQGPLSPGTESHVLVLEPKTNIPILSDTQRVVSVK
jgi:hypothetical protein